LRESKRYQLQRYENPFYDAENGLGPMGWYKQLCRTPALLSKQQFAVFKSVHQWRDAMARREDESLFYVMSNHLLQTIAREMPTSKEALIAVTPPHATLVRQHVEHLVSVVADAKEKGADGPEMRDAMAKSDQLADEQHNSRVQAREAAAAAIKAKLAEVKPTAIEPISAAKRPTAVDLTSVKSESSHFWGLALGSPTQQRNMSVDVKLLLPMPEVSAEVFAANGATPAKPGAVVAPPTPVTPVEADSPVQAMHKAEATDVFILREKGKKNKKRKVSDVQDELQAGLDEVNDDGMGTVAEWKARDEKKTKRREEKQTDRAEKLKKKAGQKQQAAPTKGNTDGFVSATTGSTSSPNGAPKKKSKKELKEPNDIANGFMAALLGSNSGAAEEPFDYANAPSVLNGAPSDNAGGRKKKKEKKGKKGKMEGFDPYKKALDTSKGVQRAQKERVGMAGTFKS
jgi:exosome complex exonuclease RRP6